MAEDQEADTALIRRGFERGMGKNRFSFSTTLADTRSIIADDLSLFVFVD